MIKLEHTVELGAESGFVSGFGKTLESLNTALVEIARTDIPVLILGESGTGKDVYARLLHRLSAFSQGDFRKLSCSVLNPTELLQLLHDSAMNSQEHPRRTMFLDGIDELDPTCQRVLLSALPDGGGQLGTVVNGLRVISSSCRNLEDAVEAGTFRKELYFRINGMCLRLPPLRERKEDIGAFLEHFLKKHSQDLERAVPSLDQETLDVLTTYDWPGNIRQLENLVRKMVALGNSQLAVNDILAAKSNAAPSTVLSNPSSLKVAARAASKKAERELILQALERTHWNRKRAARELQVSYKSLLYKIKQIGVSERKPEG